MHSMCDLSKSNNCGIRFRWTGTYFNEDYRLDTTGAQSVAVLHDDDKFIIVVAQNLDRNKVYSKVFLRKNDKIELFQLLPTHQALRVLPFDLVHGQDVLRFIFVLNNIHSSSIFLWTGKEFILWKTLNKLYGQRIVYVGKMETHIFFFVSDQNNLFIYYPTTTGFDLMQIIQFDQNVVGLDLRKEKDEMPVLVVLTGSPMDPYYKVNLILLKLTFKYLEKPRKETNKVRDCLSDVREELNRRRRHLDDIFNDLIKESNPEGEGQENVSSNIDEFPGSENLVGAPLERLLVELAEEVEEMEERARDVHLETKLRDRSGKYHVYGNLTIDRMDADVIDVEILNGRKPDFENILSLTEDQTFPGRIEMDSLRTNILEVPSLNGILVEDVLLRNKSLQRVSGDFTLDSIKVQNIKFGPAGRLNEIPMSDIVTNENNERVIHGQKTFSKLKVQNVEADKINDFPAGEWLAKILPSFKDATNVEPLNFTSLTVEKLQISKLNGIPWDEFVRSIYLPVNDGIVQGNVTVTGTANIENLKTKKINGIPLNENDGGSGRSAETGACCRVQQEMKKPKSLSPNLIPDWDDSLLKEILNDADSDYENDITYFPNKQTITGDIQAVKMFVKNPVILSGKEVNLTNVPERFWMKNMNQVIDVPVEFTSGFSVRNSLKLKNINGKQLEDFVRIDQPNHVQSKMVFENVTIDGNVTLFRETKQNVNLKEMNDTTAKVSEENIVSGSKRFLGKLTARRINLKLLNGADVKDLGNFLKNDDVSGNLDVSELIIGGDLLLTNGVQVKELNGVDFDETVAKMLKWSDPNVLNKARYESLNVENLQADEINGVKIEDKLPALSKSHEGDLSLVIEGNLQVPALKANKVNGVDFDKFTKQVFIKSESQTIRGEKTFLMPVTVTGNLEGNLNEYNVTELATYGLSKTRSQNITGVFTVQEFKANDVEADVVDGVAREDFLFQDEATEQIINSDVVFGNIAVAGDIKSENLMNGCNLEKMGKINIESVATFDNLHVRGPVMWDSSQNEPGSLSYFLNNVVTRSSNQTISGPVSFLTNVTAQIIEGTHHVNDVDLAFLAEDAIYKSKNNQEVSTSLTFKGPVKVNNINVLENVLIDTINEVDITDIGQRLVRKNANTVVSGRKYFTNGFSANNFNADFISGKNTSQIVFYDDVKENKELYLPRSTFEKLIVFNDMYVTRVNGYRLNRILEDRLYKSEDDSVDSNYINGTVIVDGDVTIRDDAIIESINDVKMSDVLSTSADAEAKDIYGNIEIRQDISVIGKLDVDYINGANITALYEKALLIDEDATIDGSITFLGNVTITGNININDTVNSCDLISLTNTRALEHPSKADQVNEEYRNSLRKEVNLLSNLTSTMTKPVIFMYLEEITKLDLHLPSIHSSSFNEYNNVAEFNVYGMKHGDCGLPKECYCPAQTNIHVESLNPPVVKVEANSTRFFRFYDKELQVEVKVTTTTVSYSSRCKKSKEDFNEEYTSISWRKDDETIYEPKIETSFLSDVKFFKLGDSIYVVMAFYFHPYKNQTNNLHTVVYEISVNDKQLTKVDEIPSTGVQVLEVFWTTKGIILVVGNSFDSERFTDSVNSGVYRFNEYKNKFELLRFVKTHGILAIKSMRYKKQSFIFFVQKQSWPMLILKYNPEYDNYYFSQKLDTTRAMIRSNFLSVSVIYTGVGDYTGDVFIGIVLSDDSFRLFKYRHIEGFVEESYQEQNNVRILHPFWIGSSQYILSGSALDSSKIYKIIEQGR
ncbi:hypothetical protein RUM43_012027 [Polyplax serrata]|uniref:Uncharacterized protein n=1 Tax=Polyplax serrata TaxID=468196 RepID=A0AAN8NZ38_POLSC